MLFGGSTSSASVTRSASTVTVHVSLTWRSVWGLRRYVVEVPAGVTVNVTAPLRVQVSANAPMVVSTGSLNVTVMFESVGTSVAPLVGVVAATEGAGSARQKCRGDVEF